MSLTAEQRDLRDAVRALLASARDPGSAWGRLCRAVGVAGLAIPERYGGAGAGPAETGIVMVELGRELTPSPMLGSAVLAAQALLASGDDAACGRLLPGIADGSVAAALAWTTRAGRWDSGEVGCVAREVRGRGWQLDGEAHYVLDGAGADVLLVAARGSAGVGLFEVDPGQDGVSREASTTMDLTRELAVVRLSAARGRRVGEDAEAALARARDLACLALSAEQAGAARRALDLTVGYTLTRVQFGRVIGSFQALQHRLADLHVLVESALSLSRASASEDTPELRLRAAAVKVYCSEALMRTAAEMIQLHGAIGITWEHAAHRYLKRAHGAMHLFGTSSQHTAAIAASLIGTTSC
jgi:alkylation response protein AidB-like acyl-CoA dehydrogenase